MVAACGEDESTRPQGASGGVSGGGSGGARAGSGGRQSGGSSNGGLSSGGVAGSTGGFFDPPGGMPNTGGVFPASCSTEDDCPDGRRNCVGAKEGPACVPGDCTADGNCEGDHYCYRGECVAHREYGESCGWEHKCRPGLACVFQVCTDPLRANSPCDAPCEDKASRCFTDDKARPFCVRQTTTCPDGSTVCTRQEYCERPGDAGAWQCARRGTFMAPCDGDAMCTIGYYCSLGNCVPRYTGDTCAVDADCDQGAYCTATAFSPGERICMGRDLPLQPCGEWAGNTDEGCVWGFRCDHEARRCEPLVMPLCPGGCPLDSKCGTAVQGGTCKPETE